MKNTVSIIGSKGLPANYGGFETLADHLSQFLAIDFNVIVTCESSLRRKEYVPETKSNISRIFIPFKANGLQSVLHDFFAYINVIRKSDIILILGVTVGFFLPVLRLFFGKKKVILHVDGIEWRRQKWNSFGKLFLKRSFIISIKNCDTIITDSQLIQRYIKTLTNIPVNVIQYGFSISHQQTISSNSDYFLTIARAEKENNLELIASVFTKHKQLNWKLVSNFNHTKYGKKLKSKYGNKTNIELIDANYNQNTLNFLRNNAKVYIHGHSAGGCNPSLVEILPYKKPVVCFDTYYNRETTFNAGVYFKTNEDLEYCLLNNKYLECNSVYLYNMSQTAYDWQTIANKYISVFKTFTK